MATEPLKDIEPAPLPVALRSAQWVRSNRSRLLKFGTVGVLGVGVNLVVFNAVMVLLGPLWTLPGLFVVANAWGFIVSVFTNFLLNDGWTWGDREKGGRAQWFRRLAKYYITASSGGLVQVVTAWVTLTFFWSHFDWTALGYPLTPSLAVLTGIGCGMFINFSLSHLWAFRDAPSPTEDLSS